MAVYESGYPSLIQGASQQVPDKRLDGQVSNQLNMVSDALTGLRRRKGFELLRFLENSDDARFWWFSISGASYMIAHDYSTGSIRVYSDKGILVGSIQNNYLIGAYQDFQYTSVSGLGAVLNTQVLPKMQTIQERKYLEGFIDVVTGEVQYNWDIRVVHVTESNQAYTCAASVYNGSGVEGPDNVTTLRAGLNTRNLTGDSSYAQYVVRLLLIARVAQRLRILNGVRATLALGHHVVERQHDARVRVKIEVPLAIVLAGLRTLHRKVGARFSAMRANSPVLVKNTHTKARHAAGDGTAFHGHALLLGVHGSENRASGKGGVTLVGHARIVL